MDIFEKLQKVNEQEEHYRHSVELSVYFEPSLSDDIDIEAPDKVELQFDIDVEHRSWGIKDVNVFPRGVVEFDVVVNKGNGELVVPVKIDFSIVESEIVWVEGSGIAPAELRVILGGEAKNRNEVKKVEIDFYYWKP